MLTSYRLGTSTGKLSCAKKPAQLPQPLSTAATHSSFSTKTHRQLTFGSMTPSTSSIFATNGRYSVAIKPALRQSEMAGSTSACSLLPWYPGGILSNYGHKEGSRKFSLPCYISYNNLSEHLNFYTEQSQVTICKTGVCVMGDKSPKNKEKKKKKQVDKQNQKKEKAGSVPPVPPRA